MKHKILGYLFLAAVAVVVVGGIYLWQNPKISNQDQQANNPAQGSGVNSYASCVAAGNSIQESYPSKCTTNGMTFVQPIGGCIQVIATARNPQNGEVKTFPTPCDIPVGWVEVSTDEQFVSVLRHGGLCMTGSECKTEVNIAQNGEVRVDGKKTGLLTKAELSDLTAEIESADYRKIKSAKFSGTCPVAYDGQETIYTFYSEGGIITVASCTTQIDENSSPFKIINSLVAKYQ